MLGVVVSYPHKPAVGLQVGQVQGEGGGAFGQSRRGSVSLCVVPLRRLFSSQQQDGL